MSGAREGKLEIRLLAASSVRCRELEDAVTAPVNCHHLSEGGLRVPAPGPHDRGWASDESGMNFGQRQRIIRVPTYIFL